MIAQKDEYMTAVAETLYVDIALSLRTTETVGLGSIGGYIHGELIDA